MGTRMKNAPICFALAQVRFNPILTLDQFLPTIQDSLRKAGFPDFQKVFLATINLNLGNQPVAETPVSALSVPQTRYRFMDAAKHSGFVLDQSFLAFETTHYDTFEPFLAAFVLGLETVHNAADLNFSERIGVRFLDAVLPKQGEDVTRYLSPAVVGLVGQLSDRDLVHSISETRTELNKTVLVSRAIVYKLAQKGDVGFPPDLQHQLKLMDKFTNVKEGLYAMIDTDSWYEERNPFDLHEIERHFVKLHDDIGRSFGLMVSDHALKTWND